MHARSSAPRLVTMHTWPGRRRLAASRSCSLPPVTVRAATANTALRRKASKKRHRNYPKPCHISDQKKTPRKHKANLYCLHAHGHIGKTRANYLAKRACVVGRCRGVVGGRVCGCPQRDFTTPTIGRPPSACFPMPDAGDCYAWGRCGTRAGAPSRGHPPVSEPSWCRGRQGCTCSCCVGGAVFGFHDMSAEVQSIHARGRMPAAPEVRRSQLPCCPCNAWFSFAVAVAAPTASTGPS
eukprot:COSAG04_NODE_111_length_25781_cov_90.291761_17_plen_238_part_00